MSSDANRRVRLRIEGRVQGVFFRDSTRREAERLGVHGYVRNLDDGAVEAVAEGPAPAIDALVQWCHRGPPAAKVTAVKLSEEPVGTSADGPLRGFRVER